MNFLSFFVLLNFVFVLSYLSHRIYRVLIKKLRRQFSRQQFAKERDRLDDIQKQNDPLYQAWIIQKENLRIQREIEEEREMSGFFYSRITI